MGLVCGVGGNVKNATRPQTWKSGGKRPFVLSLVLNRPA